MSGVSCFFTAMAALLANRRARFSSSVSSSLARSFISLCVTCGSGTHSSTPVDDSAHGMAARLLTAPRCDLSAACLPPLPAVAQSKFGKFVDHSDTIFCGHESVG